MVTRYTQQFLRQVDWGGLDFLILDLPPGTGDIQLTIVQTVALAGAVIVTTPRRSPSSTRARPPPCSPGSMFPSSASSKT